MKNIPGIKILGFFALVLAVGFAVYCGAQTTPTPTDTPIRNHGAYILKFGWHDANASDCESVELDWNRFHAALQSIAPNPQAEFPEARYKFVTWDQGHVVPAPATEHRGSLRIASEPQMPNPQSSPRSVKTQTTAAVTFNSTKEAQTFLNTLNGTASVTATPTPTAGSP